MRKKIHLAKRIPLAALRIPLVVQAQLAVVQKLKMIHLVLPVAAILIPLVEPVAVTRLLKNPVTGIVFILFDLVERKICSLNKNSYFGFAPGICYDINLGYKRRLIQSTYFSLY